MSTNDNQELIFERRGGARLEGRRDGSYYAELPGGSPEELGSTITRLIDLAFGQLGARRLEVRVRGDDEHA